jgi:hypothetical protein
MGILGAINPPDAIRKILDRLGLPTSPPPAAAAVSGDNPDQVQSKFFHFARCA